MMQPPSEQFVQRALIVTSVLVGLIAYDAWQYRRQIVRFARFVNIWNNPLQPAADRSYREATNAAHQ